MIKISIYQNNKKILGGITNIEENKVKEMIDSEINTLVPDIKKNMLICPNDKSPKEFALENSSKSQVVEFVQWGGTHSDSVAQYVTYKFIRGTDPNWGTLVAIINDTNYRRTIKYCGYDGYREDGAKWGDWINVNTTKVADVAWTNLTINSWATGTVRYCVKNGICYVHVQTLKSSTMNAGGQTITSGLPVPQLIVWHNIASNNATQGSVLIKIDATGKMVNSSGLNDSIYFGTFSYPVKEN